MADGTLGWAEILSRMDDGRQFMPIVNRLRQLLSFTDHMRLMAASNTAYHKFLIRTDEPRGYWRTRGTGFRPEHSESGMETEPIGLMGTMSEVKDEYLRESKNPGQVRFQEDMAFMDGLAKSMEAAMFYASQSNDSQSFDGLAVRLNSLSQFGVKGAGLNSGKGESIYLVEHGGDGLFVVFPAGVSTAGISMTPRPPQYVDYSATDNSRVWTHFTEFEFSLGMCVKHHRSVLRYANLMSGIAGANTWSLQQFLELIKETWNPGGRGMRAYITRNMWAQLQWAATRMGLRTDSYDAADDPRRVNMNGPSLSPSPVSSMYGINFHISEQLGNETLVT